MSKFMSFLEKFNLVEKEPYESVVIYSDEEDDDEEMEENNTDEEMDELLEESKSDDEEEIEEDEGPGEVEAVEREDTGKESSTFTMNYDRKIPVDEIYKIHGMKNSDVNTIFMAGNFINALPENLPHDVKRKSLDSILKASNTDLGVLISDGENRLELLKKVSDEYNASTSEMIKRYKDEIDRLTGMINNYKRQIQLTENILEEETYMIKYEMERITKIIEFFNDEK